MKPGRLFIACLIVSTIVGLGIRLSNSSHHSHKKADCNNPGVLDFMVCGGPITKPLAPSSTWWLQYNTCMHTLRSGQDPTDYHTADVLCTNDANI